MEREHRAVISNVWNSDLSHSKSIDSSVNKYEFIAVETKLDSTDIEIKLRLGSSSCYGLVDSGAHISLINANIVNGLLDSDQISVKKLDVPIVLRFVSQITPKGQITHTACIPVTVGSITFSWTFYVMPGSYNEVLIGMDFIQACKLKWEWVDSRAVVSIRKPDAQIVQVHVSTVRSVDPIIIPPRSAKCIVVRSNLDLSDSCVLFEPYRLIEARKKLLIPRCLTVLGEGLSNIVLFNPNKWAVSVNNKSQLGVVTTISPDSVSTDIDNTATDMCVRCARATSETQFIDPDILTINLPSHLSVSESIELRVLLSKYRCAFAFSQSELGTCNLMKHKIELLDSTPVRCRPYRVSISERQEINKQVNDMLAQGIIQPSYSPYASPVVLVSKKDGSKRFCVDFRKVNFLTRRQYWPLPRIDDALDRLAGCKYFSALDIMSAYHQVEMDEASREITAFTTPDGNYEFLRMPFGLCGAPQTYQRLMDITLSGLKNSFCLVFLDDILIPGHTIQEHNERLELVLQRLVDAGLRLKPSKCNFAMQEVLYLGHVISEAGIRVNPDKVKAVVEFKTPKTVTDVRSFLSLCSYYRKFIKFFSKIALPLNQLLQKNAKFVWTPDCEKAFREFKKRLISAPILAHFDPDCPLEIHTDASSKFGLSGVLMMVKDGEKKTIAYTSRTLNSAESNYHVTELECLAVVYSIKVFRPYIYGKHFTVMVDHCSLCYLMKTNDPTRRLSRWALLLQEYDFEIKYIAGRKHLHADSLSRNPVDAAPEGETDFPETHLFNFGTIPPADIAKAQLSDIHFKQIHGALSERLVNVFPKYRLLDDVLYFVNTKNGNAAVRLCVPKGYRQLLLSILHEDPSAGHVGYFRLYDAMKSRYFWPKMKSDCQNFVASCETCQRYSRRNYPECPLKCPSQPFHTIGVDFVGKFPVSSFGNSYVVLLTDYHSRYAEYLTVPSKTTYFAVKAMVTCILTRHGIPTILYTDQDSCFKSNEFQQFCQHFHIEHQFTTANSHHSLGSTERVVDTVKHTVAKFVGDRHSNWELCIPWAIFSHNTSVHHVTKFSPFSILYGKFQYFPVTNYFLSSVSFRKFFLVTFGNRQRITLTDFDLY